MAVRGIYFYLQCTFNRVRSADEEIMNVYRRVAAVLCTGTSGKRGTRSIDEHISNITRNTQN